MTSAPRSGKGRAVADRMCPRVRTHTRRTSSVESFALAMRATTGSPAGIQPTGQGNGGELLILTYRRRARMAVTYGMPPVRPVWLSLTNRWSRIGNREKPPRGGSGFSCDIRKKMERVIGLEPTTFCLGSPSGPILAHVVLCSRPESCGVYALYIKEKWLLYGGSFAFYCTLWEQGGCYGGEVAVK